MCVCVCVCVSVTSVQILTPLYLPDKDLKTQGFTLESCRSMIALLDVSFLPPFPTLCQEPGPQ